MKRSDFLLAAVATASLALAGSAGAVPANVTAAVADANRPESDRARDGARKPAEMLEFARVKPGQTVVDLIPGSGYFTRLFAVAVGPKGRVYAYVPSELAKRAKVAPINGAQPDPKHPNVTELVAPINDFATPTPVDLVWTAQNYHDLHDPFMGPADMAKFNAAVFKALKPGGEFIVLDHSAPTGSGVSLTNTAHRIDAAVVKKEVTAAGFRFEGESNVLRNPADKRTNLVFDPAIRGHTDQFIYKFRKPG
jgi:predicted methyltransferase